MSTNFNIFLEQKSVLAVAVEVIKGAHHAEEVKRQSEIEEKKDLESELQDMGIGSKSKVTSGAPDKPVNKDQLKEQQAPLIQERAPHLPGMVSISYMAGTIAKEDEMKFKRMIFRASRGRALTYFRDLNPEGQQDYAGFFDNKMRSIYVIVFQDGQNTRNKLMKICESFNARVVEIPQYFDQNQIALRVKKVEENIIESEMIIKTSRGRLRDYLSEIQKLVSHHLIKNLVSISLLEVYRTFLQKEKALYSNLNKFKQDQKLFTGFCWIPTIDNQEVLMRVNQLKSKDHNIETPTLSKVKEHNVKPPTLLRQNEVTHVFQEIVNTYGVPNYKEVNPSVFAIVTFPFLFGIMFGDIGHGFVLFLIGAALCLFEGPLRARGMEGILQMRYLALLMGLFATFAGLIYNDLMAIPLWIWDSCYDIKEIQTKNAPHGKEGHSRIAFKTVFKPDCVYPVGIDPTWHLGSNELAYLNSLKMKISVILGVLQMGMGVFMKALNAIYRKNSLDFWFEFVPQIVLLFSLFGFMDWLIIAKWTADFTHREYMAPSIISTMIDMFLGLGAVPEGISPIIGSAGV